MAENGYEVKKGQYLAFRVSCQQKFTRLRSLGEGYSEEELRSAILGKTIHKDLIGTLLKSTFSLSDARAVSAFLMRCLCDFTYKDICKILGNITASQAANLCNKGYELIKSIPKYQNIYPDILDFINPKAS